MIPSELVYAILVGVVPSLVWLFFWTREDSAEPEPRSKIMSCFFGGAFVVLLAIPLEQYVAQMVNTDFSLYTFWSAIEEILKFAAVGLIALSSRWYDEPIDAIIYSIAVALGFAALENTLFVIGPLYGGDLAQGLANGTMRSIGATLVHVVSSALVGYTIGATFYRSIPVKIFGWLLGLAGAISIHAWFNLSIISGGADNALRTFGWIWGAVVVLIVLFEEIKVVRPKLV